MSVYLLQIISLPYSFISPVAKVSRAFLALSSLDSCCFVVQIIPLGGCQDITPGIVPDAIWNGDVQLFRTLIMNIPHSQCGLLKVSPTMQ